MTSAPGSTTSAASAFAGAPRSTIDFAMTMSPPELAEHLFGNGLEALRIDGVRPLQTIPFTGLDHPDARHALEHAEVLIAAWGAPGLSDADLDHAPRLRYLLYAGGQGSTLLPQSARERGIQVSNAGWLNAIPVAEFTVAMIVLANKQTFGARHLYRDRRAPIDRELEFPHAGNREKVVGVVAASRIGRIVIERLRDLDLRVQVYDPYLSATDAQRLGVQRVGLDELMRTSDVVTLHPPLNASTEGMITAKLLAQLRDGATLINTSRGGIVDQDALLAQLRTGRIEAILDVTTPEVLPHDHELFTMPNVFLTPHISGSMGTEIRRLGDHVATELERIVQGRPLAFPEVLP
ncbi:hydroxyacid dehydrogenase [Humibacter sp. RRB41]|uniref:hydroxyacid dehydrogenase n=1 Tax=Humibacter sp. RRB41 TaxID=2919946 RepID=UPI001FAAF758|nr:hydroxyacid dehydrogenase [Humibacter sp. RRB41]